MGLLLPNVFRELWRMALLESPTRCVRVTSHAGLMDGLSGAVSAASVFWVWRGKQQCPPRFHAYNVWFVRSGTYTSCPWLAVELVYTQYEATNTPTAGSGNPWPVRPGALGGEEFCLLARFLFFVCDRLTDFKTFFRWTGDAHTSSQF